MPKSMEVFCINTQEPEVLAYAMAKYSRSALSMKDSIAEISSQKAADFLNTFYFAYGHRSIADMSHVPMALENISMLAAIEVVDESRWDGQERSTRYQDFSKREFFTPESFSEAERGLYSQTIHTLFASYETFSEQAFEMLRDSNPKPQGMEEAAYTRTLKARAFDIARYLLPLATTTSVGQVVSSRTLSGQISRMRGSAYSELQELAGRMEFAAQSSSFGNNPDTGAFEQGAPPMSPTLVKHTEPSTYDDERKEWAREVAAEVMCNAPAFASGRDVTLISFPSLEVEVVATAIYEVTHYPMDQIVAAVEGINPHRLHVLAGKASTGRGKFDEPARTWRSGYSFCFDIHMDIGGFRDMHRHRRCVQVFQDYTSNHYAVPDPIVGTALEPAYRTVMSQAQRLHVGMALILPAKAEADYLLPLGMKRRFLMKMDLAELVYITELRTGPAGHFSYRRVAHDMFTCASRKHPWLLSQARVTDVDAVTDIFKR